MASYGPQEFQRDTGVSRETLARLEVYADALKHWQRAINLVSKKTLPDLWRRHLLDSAQLLEFLPGDLDRPAVIADMGSGAGFPGLVLAILGDKALDVHLIESDQKKVAFLRTVSRETATEVHIHGRRIEEIATIEADVVTARALAPAADLAEYAKGLISSPGFCLFLKGKGVEEELTAWERPATITTELLPSRSDPEGRILKIGGLRP